MKAKPVPMPSRVAAKSFWAKVQMACGPNGCWNWIGRIRSKDGYAHIRLGGRQILVHRIAYRLAVGQPGINLICHTCDNRRCCNPKHLFPGTYRDNNQDRARKHRNGVRVNAKLSKRIAALIPQSHESAYILARRYGVHPGVIHQVRTNRIWRDDNYRPETRLNHREACQQGKVAKLTPRQVKSIRRSPRSRAALSRQFNIHVSTVDRIRAHQTWRNV